MEPNPPKPLRQVAIADHLWEAFALMAAEMGSDRAALVNQAMHMFARLNGYLVPGSATKSASILPQPIAEATAPRAPPATAPAPAPVAASVTRPGAPRSLSLARDGAAAMPVTKDRFVIGRGKHCDLVIDSGKISREHAVIVREGADWFIEDLGSSNGTWLDKARIERRRIQDGDEYFICSERIRCVLR